MYLFKPSVYTFLIYGSTIWMEKITKAIGTTKTIVITVFVNIVI